MKILRRFINVFLVIFLVYFFGMARAVGGILHIAAPGTHSRGRYYVTERRSPERVYVEERRENTCQKTHGAFVECTGLGEYVIYDDTDTPSDEFTHVIRKIDSNHYIVGIHYPLQQITPILDISRDSITSPWHIKSTHILGRVCMPSPEVYIENVPYGGSYLIKSAVTTLDIQADEVYNCVTPLGDADEFTDILSFLASFLFK